MARHCSYGQNLQSRRLSCKYVTDVLVELKLIKHVKWASRVKSTTSIVGGSWNNKERRPRMQIRYDKKLGTFLYFPLSELRVALGVLKAIHKVCGADFILTAIRDMEEDLKPKALTFINYHHICELCVTEVDDRSPNAFLMTTRDLKGKENSRWTHYCCPTLKEKRPV